jgi:hypothetical protein
MHQRSFRVLQIGTVVTNWDSGEWNGVAGAVAWIELEAGMVGIALDNGQRCATPYGMVAIGDNSSA